jgi:TetR/AcrR family tetracycline transcriptional repressor
VSASVPSPRRGRGARAGLDADRIVAAARGMAPAAVTMQAVADALGVDRKALNHHVSDRESLLELLAIDAFRARYAAASVDLGDNWQDACRAYGRSLCRAIAETGEWIAHFRITSPRDLVVAGPAEVVAERMLAAGFDRVTVSRGMHLLVTLCSGFARDAVLAREGRHPQVEQLRAVLETSRDGYTALGDLVDARVDNYGAAQLEFDLDAFIGAMERLLPR